MAACALHGDSFHSDLADGEIRKIRHLTLYNDSPTAPLQRVHSKENRHCPRAGGAVEHDVHSTSTGDFLHTRERILFLNIDDVVRSQGLGNF